ncbi:MAG: PQQ-binding-like beta-propeller repeat protein, partial [Caldilineaceae bacterium]
SMGNSVHAVDAATLAIQWSYDAGATVDTPPAFSPAANTVVVLSRDLFVHAIDADNGQQRWRTKPTSRSSSQANNLNGSQADVRHGWPVIAEGHGVVFIRYRLDWQTLWTWSPWPGTNAEMRSMLAANPTQQPLYALRLSDGQSAFAANVGNGGFGDGDYMPMGPLPAIRRLADGSEVAYVVMRGSPCLNPQSCDGRWDARLGELLLDGSTVSGYAAGDVRFMQSTFVPTDEMPYVTAAGDQVLAGHWEAGLAHRIVDRSAARGTGGSPIVTANLPHISTSQDQDVCGSGFSSSHFCAVGLYGTRTWPAGFYLFWQQGAVYDQYWSEYASWVVSGGLVLYVSTDGTVTALEAGQPAPQTTTPATAGSPGPGADVGGVEGALNLPTDVRRLPVIPVGAASAHAGQLATVEGTLVDVFSNGKAVYLTFARPHQGTFLTRILRQDWSAFTAPPDTHYAAGQTIQVSGRIGWYQGDPVITVTSPDQVRLVEPIEGSAGSIALNGALP